MPACFYPRAQLGKLRVLDGCSECLCSLRLSQIWQGQFIVPSLLRQSVFGGLQHCCEEPDVRASSFFVWVFGTNSLKTLPASCTSLTMSLSFGRNRLQYVAFCFSFSSSLLLSWHLIYLGSSAPGQLLPSTARCATPVCCPPEDNRTSLMDMLVKVLSSIKWLIAFGISTFVILARMHLCRRRPFIQMLTFEAPPKQPQFIEERSTPNQGVPGPPIRKPVQIDHENTFHTSKSLHFVNSRCYLVRKNCFAHGTFTGSRHRRDVKLQPVRALPSQRACASCATLALCV